MATNTAPTQLKKISTTKIIQESEAPFGVLVGKAVKMRRINTAYGESVKFMGTFELRIPESATSDEQRFRSNIAYVPSAVELAVEMGLADQDPTKFKGVELAVKIYKKDNPKSVTKYEWAFDPLVPMESAADPIAHLLDKVGQLALTAPKEAGESAPKSRKAK